MGEPRRRTPFKVPAGEAETVWPFKAPPLIRSSMCMPLALSIGAVWQSMAGVRCRSAAWVADAATLSRTESVPIARARQVELGVWIKVDRGKVDLPDHPDLEVVGIAAFRRS